VKTKLFKVTSNVSHWTQINCLSTFSQEQDLRSEGEEEEEEGKDEDEDEEEAEGKRKRNKRNKAGKEKGISPHQKGQKFHNEVDE
jgi:hypothetical protein